MKAAAQAAGESVSAAAQSQDEKSIRAGRAIATSVCISCHVVSPDQKIKPIYGGLAPTFEEIANRPATSAESLKSFLDSKHWNDPAFPVKPSPMHLLSDIEKAQATAFLPRRILSTRWASWHELNRTIPPFCFWRATGSTTDRTTVSFPLMPLLRMA